MFTLDPAFVRPSYDENCFTAVPASIGPLLGAPGVAALPDGFLPGRPRTFRAVVLILLDGFGWRFFEKVADDYPALRRFAAASGVAKLTSQFPSTTAAHITCLHTGLEVGQSGVYEWQYYEPQLDAVITPLLFSYAGTKERDTLKPTGIAPERIYPTATLYQALAKSGIPSYIIQHGEYTPSTYSDVVFAGATALGYRTLPEALVNLRLLLAQQRKPTYYVLYHDRFDALCHEYGPNSPQVEAELDAFLTVLERIFLSRLDGGRGHAGVTDRGSRPGGDAPGTDGLPQHATWGWSAFSRPIARDASWCRPAPRATRFCTCGTRCWMRRRITWRAGWRGGRSSIAPPT